MDLRDGAFSGPEARRAGCSSGLIPFAFLTGYGDAAIDPRFRDVPRLTKPYSSKELSQLLEERFARI